MLTKANPPASAKIERAAAEIGASVASVASWIASWLAPVPEAVMTARAIQTVFVLPYGLALAVAASIEVVGVSINAHYQDVRARNAELLALQERHGARSTRYPLENERGALAAVVAFYGVTAAIVWATAVFEAVTLARPLTLLACLFPVVSALGTVTMNARAAFHRRKLTQDGAGLARRSADWREAGADGAQPAQVAKTGAPVARDRRKGGAVRRFTGAEWRQYCAGLNGNGAGLARELAQAENKAVVLAAWLHQNKIEPPAAEATRRRWADVALEEIREE